MKVGLKRVIGLWGLCALVPALVASQSPDKPNILLIYVDDLGWSDLGCYGNRFYETPRIDQLASEGMRFTQAYSACHICSPARASLMTGKYPARLHLTDWIPGHNFEYEKLKIPNWQKGLPAEETTIGEMLQEAGYATAWLGKWHLRGLPESEKGEDEDPRKSIAPLFHGFDAGEQDWQLNSMKSQEDPKGVFELNRQTMDFIEKADCKPWFVAVSHYSVHTPVRYNDTVRDRYEENSEQGAKHTNSGYAAMLDALDESVGQLLDFLAERKLDENTLVVFYSDNGGLDYGGGKGPTNNAPLREGKGTLYEGGLRVPLILRWEGVIESGEDTDAIVTTPDFLTTFARLAQVDSLPERLDGVDIWDSVLEDESLEREAIYWHYPHYHQGMPGGAVRKGRYKLIEFFEDSRLELYDLESDIGESINLASDLPAKTEELHRDLKQWRSAVGAQQMAPNPEYDPSKAKKK